VALRALGDWPDFAAAEPLLALASDANLKLAHHALAIQGIVRLVKTLDNQPPARRVDAALAALRAARRDEERRLALSALGVVPDAKAVEALRPLLGDASLKNDAGATALTLAEALRRGQRPLARQLAQAVRDANISEALNQRAEALLNR
jgi:hypothetical protein